jgi:hypothetical protein
VRATALERLAGLYPAIRITLPRNLSFDLAQ